MFPLFETIRIVDGAAQQLAYHQIRMEQATEAHYGVPLELNLAQVVDVPKKFSKGLVKLRLDYGVHACSQAYAHYKARSIKTLRTIKDEDISYKIKATDRSHIDRLWSQRGPCDDILIVKDGMVTDSSYTNILFLKGNDWITPNTPLLKGTQRAYLLDAGLITEASVHLDAIGDYDGFQLVNAMMPFQENYVMNVRGIHY
ncbi:MAG: hypothetical protein HKN87_16700 [Saprospiraceae bacterium]|nr:hypothetical protein [Saprospiraceae bacterium]